ncbi:MAG: hypothetical protein KJP21_01545 [Bacteroidia bacterium]|nr:hypothetical protein [Bacteroidia bacterium]
MKNTFIFCIVFILSISGCKQDPPFSETCDKKVEINSQLYNSAPEKLFTASSIKINGNCLEVTYYFCGSDTAGDLKLIDSGTIYYSRPVKRQLRFSFNATSVCLALIPHTQTFDLTPLKRFDSNHIVLNIKGWNKPINYYY